MRLATSSHQLTTAESLGRIACLYSHSSDDSGDTAVYWLAYLAIGNSWLPSAVRQVWTRRVASQRRRQKDVTQQAKIAAPVDVVGKRAALLARQPLTARQWLSMARSPAEQVTVWDKRGWAMLSEAEPARAMRSQGRHSPTPWHWRSSCRYKCMAWKHATSTRVQCLSTCPAVTFNTVIRRAWSIKVWSYVGNNCTNHNTQEQPIYKSLSGWYHTFIVT